MAALAIPALALLPLQVSAQCVMCGQAAAEAQDPTSLIGSFAAGVLVLLIPVNLLLGGLALLVWKARNWDGALHEPDPPQKR